MCRTTVILNCAFWGKKGPLERCFSVDSSNIVLRKPELVLRLVFMLLSKPCTCVTLCVLVQDVTSRGGVRAFWHVVDSRKRLLQYHQRAKLMRHTSSLLARGHRKHPALHTRHAVYSLRIASNEAPVFGKQALVGRA